jgi:hypothetical protein
MPWSCSLWGGFPAEIGFDSMHGADSIALEAALSRLGENRLGNKSVLNPERFFHCCPQIPLNFGRISHCVSPYFLGRAESNLCEKIQEPSQPSSELPLYSLLQEIPNYHFSAIAVRCGAARFTRA